MAAAWYWWRATRGRSWRAVLTVALTLPSFGLLFADHVSLGRGALLPESTLLAIQDITAGVPSQQAAAVFPAFPSAVAIDMAPGTSADARRLVSRIASADPDGSPGSTYPLGPQRGAAILNAAQMGSQPLALAIGLAAAAVLALALTVLASVRQRRRQLAQGPGPAAGPAPGDRRLAGQHHPGHRRRHRGAGRGGRGPMGLGELRRRGGVRASQHRAGAAGGLGFAALLAAGNLLAVAPALIAARTRPAAALRAE